MIRAFVALALPGEVVAALVAAQAGLPVGRALPRESLHLTVAFLGAHPEPVVEEVHYALRGLREPGFALTLAGLGQFGGARPRSVHAEVVAAPGLRHLRGKVLQAARGAGIELARARYVPHVTLARFGAGLTGAEVVRLDDFLAGGAGFRAGPFDAAAFRLYRSTLARSGAVYDDLAEYPLRAGQGWPSPG